MTRRKIKFDDTRDRLIRAVRSHVPFDGWSEKALITAAEECGIEINAARRAFPEGAASLIEYHSALSDRLMEAILGAEALEDMGVRQRTAKAVRCRLAQESDHPEAARAAVAFLAQPMYAPLSIVCLYGTADSIWSAIGDKSTDFNFYSKRAILAGVYVATFLYWLDDESEDHMESWAFLDRRLEDVMKLGKLRARLQNMLPSPKVMANVVGHGHLRHRWL